MKYNIIYPLIFGTCISLGFTACDDDSNTLIDLASPTVSMAAKSFDTLSFEWEKVDNAVQYAYQLLDSEGKEVETGTSVGTTVSFSGLLPATTYTLNVWALAAINSDYSSAPTVTLSATTDPLTQLATPQPVMSTSGNAFVFTWAAVDNAENYVYKVECGGNIIVSDTISASAVTLRSLEMNDYQFSVQAITDEVGFENSGFSSPLLFTVTRAESWRVTGTYYSYELNATWDATMIAYDDDSYVIKSWYGVDGFDFSFTINPNGEYGAFELLCGEFDENTWLYSVATGRTDVPEVYVYPYYDYSYLEGNAVSGTVNINHEWSGSYVNDTFTWSSNSVDNLVGTYLNVGSGWEYLTTTWDWSEYSYDNYEATIAKIDDSTVSIDGIWWVGCPVVGKVNFSTMTITIDPQVYYEDPDYADAPYIFAGQTLDSNYQPTNPVIAKINDDMSITLQNFSYWQDYGVIFGSGYGWYGFLSGATATLTKK